MGSIITNGVSMRICLIISNLLALSSFPKTCINVIVVYITPKNGNPKTVILTIDTAKATKLLSATTIQALINP